MMQAALNVDKEIREKDDFGGAGIYIISLIHRFPPLHRSPFPYSLSEWIEAPASIQHNRSNQTLIHSTKPSTKLSKAAYNQAAFIIPHPIPKSHTMRTLTILPVSAAAPHETLHHAHHSLH